MTGPNADHHSEWRQRLMSKEILAAFITGIFSLSGGFVAGAFKGSAIGVGPSVTATVTATAVVTETATTTVTAQPVASNTPIASAEVAPSVSPNPPLPSPSPASVKVPLAELCGVTGASGYCGSSFVGTIQVGGHLFAYVGATFDADYPRPPDWSRILHFPANTCSELDVTFASDDSNGGTTDSSNLQVLQTVASAATANAAHGSVGHLKVMLDGGPFDLEANSTTGDQIFVNGYALCASSSGI